MKRGSGLQRRTELGPGKKALERGHSFKTPRAELQPVSDRKLRDAQHAGRPAPRSSFKKTGGAVSPASSEQRAKVKGAVSIVSGEGPCDPAHLWPRSKGGCDSALCVVELTRLEHEAFDRGELDVLPALIANERWDELAHMIEAHHVDPISMLHELTGDRYEPARRSAA